MTRLSLDASVAAKRKRRMRGMLIVLLASMVTLAALVADAVLHRVVEEGTRAEALLLQLHASAYRLSAFEWQAIAEGAMSSKIVAGVRDAQDGMKRTMASLEQLDANVGNLRLVRRNYDAYLRAMDEEFKLIDSGNLAQARRVDEELVDPAFDAVTRALHATGPAYRMRAEHMEQLAFFGSAFILLLAIATIGVLVWQTQKAHAAIEAAAVEQRALIRGQNELRLCADNIPAMTVSYDANLRCRFANKAFAAFFGFTVEDILGKHLREIVGEDGYSEIKGYFAQMLQGRTVTFQRMRTLPNGEPLCLETKLVPHIGDQGKVLGCFAVTADITEHKLTQERIQRMAHHDGLTSLPNRLLFNDRLEQAISLAKRDSRQFALLYLDLDRFKQVNDNLGHTAGDELLQAVAARIRRQVRESDTLARVGGDEFAIILPDIARREEVQTVARKIIGALVTPFQLGSQQQRVDIGTSIGIALYPADARDADALIKAADAAMYTAKQEGNSFRFCGA